MNTLPKAKKAAVLRALTEGNSIRATARLVGVSKTTILKLLVEAGEFCAVYHDHLVRNLPTRRLEADEIWAFVGAKQKNAKAESHGDIWTFTAIDAEAKFMVSWLVGARTVDNAVGFMQDVAARLVHRIQLTTDGNRMYGVAVEGAFGYWGVDYAMLVKRYAPTRNMGYSPGPCIGIDKEIKLGQPDPAHISTSYVERANLNIRLFSRRHTRLTNGFSRKVENHAHAMALHFMVHNFCRSHGTLTKAREGIKTSPAMAVGLTDHVWSMEELVSLMDPARLIR